MLTRHEEEDIKFWRALGRAYEKRSGRVRNLYYNWDNTDPIASGICNELEDVVNLEKRIRREYQLSFIHVMDNINHFWYDPDASTRRARETAFDLRATACYLIADAIEQGMMW